MTLFQIFSAIVTISIILIRITPKVKPLFDFIPVKWQWVPATVAASAGVLSTLNPADLTQSLETILVVLVAIVLAAQKGLHRE
jgi:hypothetical protein